MNLLPSSHFSFFKLFNSPFFLHSIIVVVTEQTEMICRITKFIYKEISLLGWDAD